MWYKSDGESVQGNLIIFNFEVFVRSAIKTSLNYRREYTQCLHSYFE